jgi:hypothetical protein
VQRVMEDWGKALRMAQGGEQGFLDRAADLAVHGTPAAIHQLLAREAEVQRLDAVRRLPDPPARAIEMLEGWIVLGISDKALLDEEDIANAHVIVYGLAEDAGLRRFGPRYFFTPGALTCGKVGVLELLGDGQLQVSVYEYSGTPLWSEILQGRAPQLVVTT